ncbi:MAG: universal stress protein [Cellulosimicrobium cellulans]
MNEPESRSLADAGVLAFVPRRITGPVLAGVVPEQPVEVVQRAAELADNLGVKLICAYVDITTYLDNEPDEGIQAGPFGSEAVDDAEGVSAGIRERLEGILATAGVRWSFLILSGNPARALGQLAESANVSLIVVGTREPDLGTRLEHLLVGSVAVQLTRSQFRPVLVVPLARQTPRKPARTPTPE